MSTLETYYVLKGSAYVMARHPGLTPDGIRQMASRLNLAEELTEYTPLVDVAEEAGVSHQAVWAWVGRNGYRRFCRQLGHRLLIPLPVVRLYLTAQRVARRPRGWWGSARAAEHLGVTTRTLRRMIDAGTVNAVRHGKTDFIDPHSLPPRAPAPPLDAVSLAELSRLIPLHNSQLGRELKRAGHPVTVYCGLRKGCAAYTTAEAARRFLTERGYREELVEVYLRRAVMGGSKPKGETR